MKPLFECHDLRKTYATHTVVDGVTFEIYPGECLGVIGPNGAGKTTTLRMCLGLTEPDSGTISAFGYQMPQDALAIKSRLGVVSQFDSLDPDFTCAENLMVFGRYFGLRKSQMMTRINELLEFAALSHKAQARPDALSGGMKRRLSLARALIHNPDLLLLDEPTTGLDPQARHLMWERLGQLLQQGKSILLTTHFMDEAERLCDRLLVLDQGQKIAEGTPQALIEEHLEKHVIEVYGTEATALAHSEAATLAQRVETSGETVFFYTDAPTPLLAMLNTHERLRVLHRPANLEDLFLKLTGRQIREEG
jgi:lipooligosaccharide transport system ATP-binding protein